VRIVYVAPFALEEPVGHTSHVLATIKEIARKGHEVVLLARNCPPDICKIANVVLVPTIEKEGLQSVSFGVSAAWLLAREIGFGRPDVVYARMFKSLLASVAVARTFRVPVVVEVNSDLANERRVNRRLGMTSRVEALEERTVFNMSAAIVAVTEGVAKYIEDAAPRARTHTSVIENGVDTDIYHPLDKERCSARLGLDATRKRVVFTGAFQVWQGIFDLLAAAEKICEKRDDVEFVFVGDGPLRSEMKHFVTEHGMGKTVRVTGFVPEETVAEWIGAGDVCVAPYNTGAVSDGVTHKDAQGALMRGSPLKIYTYMACGRPVVASHFKEAGAYIEEESAGLGVAPENPEALAEAILRLLGDTGLSQEMGERGRRLAEEQHSWSKVVDSYLEVAGSVARNR
jgi:alpha-maltose-1-phosphate synthase